MSFQFCGIGIDSSPVQGRDESNLLCACVLCRRTAKSVSRFHRHVVGFVRTLKAELSASHAITATAAEPGLQSSSLFADRPSSMEPTWWAV